LVPTTGTAARATKDRLLRAAGALFAERGFHGTTIRDIALRGGVNVAAGNYHFGSKKALYLAVLRTEFLNVRALFSRRGASRTPAELARLSRRRLEDLLRARVRAMLDLLLGPPPGLHGTLMQREMCDPSEALPVIVEEFVRPMTEETAALVARLEPTLDRAAVDRCVWSIIGQVLFYRTAMPALLRMLDADAYPRGFTADVAAHIVDFSLGGMGARRPRRRRRAG
jgi:TetR/AcrR family transcriptional regulator, regulator of cefoperazone and chloramphenicol sensitivity